MWRKAGEEGGDGEVGKQVEGEVGGYMSRAARGTISIKL